MKIIIFAPHPDDLEFFMGGTTFSHLQKGDEVHEFLLTYGENELSTFYKSDELKKKREEEAKEGAQILGFNNIKFLDFVAKNIKYTRENIEKIKRVLESISPDIIYAPSFKNRLDFWIRDHKRAGKIIRDAFQEIKKGKLLLYGSLRPTYFVPVTRYIEKINQALKVHQTQRHILKTFNFLRLYFLRRWGRKVGEKYAEGFEKYSLII